jgi:hypothetical protein
LSKVVGVTYATPVIEELLALDPDFEMFVNQLDTTVRYAADTLAAPEPESPIDRARRVLNEAQGSIKRTRNHPNDGDA